MAQVQKVQVNKSGMSKFATKPVRLKQETIRKLQKILDAVNKKDFGKKVRPDAVIDTALSLIDSREIEGLRNSSLSNVDRLEQAYRRYVAKDKSITKDAFLGMLLEGASKLPEAK